MLSPLLNPDLDTLSIRVHSELERTIIGLRTVSEALEKLSLKEPVEDLLREAQSHLEEAKDLLEAALFDDEPPANHDLLLHNFVVEHCEDMSESGIDAAEWFSCRAESFDHAIEQTLSSDPGRVILSVVLDLSPEVEYAPEP